MKKYMFIVLLALLLPYQVNADETEEYNILPASIKSSVKPEDNVVSGRILEYSSVDKFIQVRNITVTIGELIYSRDINGVYELDADKPLQSGQKVIVLYQPGESVGTYTARKIFVVAERGEKREGAVERPEDESQKDVSREIFLDKGVYKN